MKHFIVLTLIALTTIFILFSCKKEVLPDKELPPPTDTSIQREFKLIFTNLSQQAKNNGNLTVSITAHNVRLPIEKIQLSTPLECKNLCGTSAIKLPKGSYQLERILINDANGITQFAVPVAGSVKAVNVNKPLNIPLQLDENKEINLEILPILETDSSEAYGYPAGTFGKIQENPQPPMDKRVYIRYILQVGEVVYDSIPAQLILKSWDVKGEMDYRIHYLGGGQQFIYLPSKAVRFQLSIAKWETYSELSFTQEQVQENDLLTLTALKNARKIKTVIENRITNGKVTPVTKTDFEYNTNGEILQRKIWGKRDDMSTYLKQKDEFSYTNGDITSIKSYDEKNTLIKTLTAQYRSKGRVSTLEEVKDQNKIVATALYLPLDFPTNLNRDYRIDVIYEYDQFKDHYSKTMYGGTVVMDKFISNSGSMEEGTYDFDFCINPYVHLKIPDLLFSQYTAHNMVISRKIRRGAYTQHEPYEFKYVYDNEGYPIELLTKYRSTESKVDTYMTQTLFTY